MLRVALALVCLGGVAHADKGALDVLLDLEKAYKEPQHLQASFEQTVTNAIAGKPATNTGMIFVAKPNKIRFNYHKPNTTAPRHYYLFDGKFAWYVDPPKLQFAQRPLATNALPAAVAFFLGADSLSKDFTPAFAKTRTGTKIHLDLTPKQPSAAYAKVTLVLDNKAMRVERTIITDSSGNVSEFAFTNVVQNQAAPTDTFVVSPNQIANFKRIP